MLLKGILQSIGSDDDHEPCDGDYDDGDLEFARMIANCQTETKGHKCLDIDWHILESVSQMPARTSSNFSAWACSRIRDDCNNVAPARKPMSGNATTSSTLMMHRTEIPLLPPPTLEQQKNSFGNCFRPRFLAWPPRRPGPMSAGTWISAGAKGSMADASACYGVRLAD